jgi:hypothetical protein
MELFGRLVWATGQIVPPRSAEMLICSKRRLHGIRTLFIMAAAQTVLTQKS